ncbi:hypothetical protein DS745_19780 [Anaerobacillus alkaliphilus]|uniref:Uncharacterized protein n=1 Tax=Anaerobacillus alkaliphilus TaxID=1548597 RepID=A0A4Q0VR05_9BACI|nr:hypothetical protein [Anaerobacillus alkaliphilus]RXI98561.1 hypothetical protein DS745_19780 [Anaerobacillus alkaliphilus]
MGKWVLLSSTGLACLTVWGIVIWSIVFADKQQYTKLEEVESVIQSEELVVLTKTSWDEVVDHEAAEMPTTIAALFMHYGITKTDALKIAPNGVISIDDLLIIVTHNDQH